MVNHICEPISSNQFASCSSARVRQGGGGAPLTVDRLIEAARKRGRNGARDAAAILLAYRHGLRAQELCSLRWSQIDLRNGRLHVNRAKGGIESVHPLHGPELRAFTATTAGIAVCIRYRSRNASYNVVVLENDPANRQGCEASASNPSAYAATLNRIQACE